MHGLQFIDNQAIEYKPEDIRYTFFVSTDYSVSRDSFSYMKVRYLKGDSLVFFPMVRCTDSNFQLVYDEEIYSFLRKSKLRDRRLVSANLYHLYQQGFEEIDIYSLNFRNLFVLDHAYQQYKDLNKGVIQPAIRELKERGVDCRFIRYNSGFKERYLFQLF